MSPISSSYHKPLNYLNIILLSLCCTLVYTSHFKPLQTLLQQKLIDETSIIRLANEQKFSIPLNGRYISYDIKYYPDKSNDCTFKQPTVQYKKLGESNNLFEEDDEVVSMLILKRSEKVILADPYYNILIYSTDQHKLLRLLSPKTSLLSKTGQINNKQKKVVSSLSMLTTQEQDYIYYLSPDYSFLFSSKSLGSQTQQLNITLPQTITKAIYHKNHVIIISQQQGIFIYKLDKKTHILSKVQQIKRQDNSFHNYVDMQFDVRNEIFYMLTESTVEVYLFKPSEFPNPESHEFTVLKLHDDIIISNYTRNHINSAIENNQHLNLEISSVNPNQNQIFVLFRHNMRQNVIAEFVYDSLNKDVTFLRYFKFQMQIRQIHTIQDVIVVVGNQILGLFPYGIDPRLIKEEFNGWITMSDIEKIAITQGKYFVGVTKNSIQFGGLQFSQEIGLNCQLTQTTQTKSIIFSGNLTWCNPEQQQFYHKYCSYTKKFILQSMDIVTTSTVSSSVWIVMMICTVCIILGILIMLMMHKRKQDAIRKLELYFEEKRRTEIPASSDRREGNL